MSLSMARAEPDTGNGFVQSTGARMREHRAYSRIWVQYPAVARVHGTEAVIEATVTNLSGNGLRLRMNQSHDLSTLLSVTMQCEASHIVSSAEVVRVHEADGADAYEVACRLLTDWPSQGSSESPMPELPDLSVYVERLRALTVSRRLERVQLLSPFLLRSVEPPIKRAEGVRVEHVERLGKRIVISLEGNLRLVLHLMIAGRLRWRAPGVKIPKPNLMATFTFETGTLLFTEASKKKRASLYLVAGDDGMAEHQRGGLEVLECDAATFKQALVAENHTLKRALTDPRILSGIGYAYSEVILWDAELSPFKQTQSLPTEDLERLYQSTVAVLTRFTNAIRDETGDGFPEKVTAFRPDMAVHGKYKEPCPRCAAPVQRIVFAANEANYCARCQTGGKLLADRALSRLLKANWPKTLEELE